MHSYIDIYNFKPTSHFSPLETLVPLIEETMREQQAEMKLDAVKQKIFQKNILHCMEIYYKLVGVTQAVIDGEGVVKPEGILHRYTESLIHYFKFLKEQIPKNKEISILEYSGVSMIKIRYKYTDSVIKKLVKLGLRDPQILESPLKLFLNGGALHDLIGILFICSSPFEKIWVARSLYNFFAYEHRTDDHLQYGFYRVKRESGYRALHCDHTRFHPRFDKNFLALKFEECPDIFACYDVGMSDLEVLQQFKDNFNIEIQIHTVFENLWANMEHRNSYDIQAKGAGRSPSIMAQWNLLSDTMKNLEIQFERLQIETEQARFTETHWQGYTFVKDMLEEMGNEKFEKYCYFSRQTEELETLFASHEISRQEYVQKLRNVARNIDLYVDEQSDHTSQVIFRMQSAFVYYGLANHRNSFNSEDIRQFVQHALLCYEENHQFLCEHPNIYKSNLINIVALMRHLQLGQRYGLGLIHTGEGILTEDDISIVSYEKSLMLFSEVIVLFNGLSQNDIAYLKNDYAAYCKLVHRTDMLAREWELFNHAKDSEQSQKIVDEIVSFRKRHINRDLVKHFNALLEADKITNIGFVVQFYSTVVWHGLLLPLHALKQIIKYSSYDKIKTSDLFFYELAAYRFLVLNQCNSVEDCTKEVKMQDTEQIYIDHYENYHRKNMIQQLFRIHRDESNFTFHKARFHFEKLTQTPFHMDHFSETVNEYN